MDKTNRNTSFGNTSYYNTNYYNTGYYNTGKEACVNWREKMGEEDRQTVMPMPNFDKNTLKDYFGLEETV